MAAIGQDMAVGSGDTWFFPPTTGTLSQGVHWDGKQYFMKLGIWTTMSAWRCGLVSISGFDDDF
jgi:hypothetical protein